MADTWSSVNDCALRINIITSSEITAPTNKAQFSKPETCKPLHDRGQLISYNGRFLCVASATISLRFQKNILLQFNDKNLVSARLQSDCVFV